VLGTPDAGTSDATSWASSANAADRVFAAQLLADIGTPSALSVLQTLVSDSDPLVADVAHRMVANGSDTPATVLQQTIGNPGGL
jgi:hypothetical protein